MARTTAAQFATLAARLSEAKDLAYTAELSPLFTYNKRLYVYEAAYLLGFSAWEVFLERTTLSYLCGYAYCGVRISRIPAAPYFPSASAALAYLLVKKNKDYFLWHGSTEVKKRVREFLVNCPVADVISSAEVTLKDYSAVRHHVAHRSADTKVKFEAAANRLAVLPNCGGRAGRFLRISHVDPHSGAQTRWLHIILDDLERLAQQM